MHQLPHPADLSEVAESLFATFLLSDTFPQNACGELAANLPSVLEAVSDGLRRAVDANGHSIDLGIDDSLRERAAGKSHKAQFQAVDGRFLCSAMDRHPNRTRITGNNTVPGEGRLKANDAMRYSRAREHDLMFEVCREALTSVETATDLDE